MDGKLAFAAHTNDDAMTFEFDNQLIEGAKLIESMSQGSELDNESD